MTENDSRHSRRRDVGMVSMEEDFGGDLCNSLETSHAVTEGRE